MKYTKFKNNLLQLPIITDKDFIIFDENRQAIKNQLKRWQDKRLVIKLRRGMYILNKNDRKINPSNQFIANQLYAPSYVSMEYALGFYGLIPERVVEVTSVTSRKTAQFKNELGVFTYQHIKPAGLRGFKALKDESGPLFFIAEPEKAVVDFLYLNLAKFKPLDMDIFENSYRFQNTEGLKERNIMHFARLFNSKKLAKIAGLFCRFMKEEG